MQKFLINLILFLVPLVFIPFLDQIFEIGKLFIFSILLLLLLVGLFFSKQKKTSYFHPVLYTACIYFLLIGISTITSDQTQLSFFGNLARHQGLATYILLAVFLFFTLWQSFKKKKIQQSFNVIIFTSTIVCIFALLQSFNLDTTLWNKEEFLGRAFSTLGHPNFLGQFLVLVIPLLFYQLFKVQNIYQKVVYFALIILHIDIVFLSGSRASLIAFYFSILAFFILRFIKSKKTKILFFVIGLIFPIFFVISVNAFGNSAIIQNTPVLQRLIINEENNRSIYTRLILWKQGMQAIKEKWLFGHGPDTQMIVMTKYMNKDLLRLESPNNIPDRLHNDLLDQTFSFGVAGGFLYYLFIVLLFYYALKHLKSNNEDEVLIPILCAILAYTISNQFGFPTLSHLIYFWFFVALTISIIGKKEMIKIPKIIIGGVLLVLLINVVFTSREVYANYIFKHAKDNIGSAQLEDAHLKLKKAFEISKHFEYSGYYLNNIINTSNSNHLNEAMNATASIKKQIPHFSDIYLLEGKIFNSAEDYNQANNAFQKASELAPMDIDIWSDWAKNLYNQKQFKGAIQKYEHLFSLIPHYWDKEQLVSVYDKEKARIFFKNMPNFRLNFLYLARSYFQTGDTEKSLYYLQFADQNSIHTLTTYGVIYGKLNDLKKSLSYYQKAFDIDKENKEIEKIINSLQKAIK